MPGTVGYIGNQMFTCTFGIAQQTVNRLDNHFDKVNVFPFIETTYIIGIRYFSLMENQIDGTSMIHYIEPITHILPFSVNRKRLAMTDVVDEERYQFFRELIRTVIIGTIGHDGRHTISIVKRPHKMVARSFGS